MLFFYAILSDFKTKFYFHYFISLPEMHNIYVVVQNYMQNFNKSPFFKSIRNVFPQEITSKLLDYQVHLATIVLAISKWLSERTNSIGKI